jgi:hypothetical protein
MLSAAVASGGERVRWELPSGLQRLTPQQLQRCIVDAGGVGGVGDSAGRELLRSLLERWPLPTPGMPRRFKGLMAHRLRLAGAADNGTVVVSYGFDRQVKDLGPRQMSSILQPAFVFTTRGLWDQQHYSTPVSIVFADTLAALNSVPGNVSRVVVYVPHCVVPSVAEHRAACVTAERSNMYRSAVACAAAEHLESTAAAGASASASPPRLGVYDVCDLARAMAPDPRYTDGLHLPHDGAMAALDEMLLQFACPALRSVEAVRLPHIWSTAGLATAELAVRSLRERFDCRPYRSPWAGNVTSLAAALAIPPAPEPIITPSGFQVAPPARSVADVAAGYTHEPICSCGLRPADECDLRRVTHRLASTDFEYSPMAGAWLPRALCSFHSGLWDVQPHDPTNMPPEAIQPTSALFTELIVTMCAVPTALPLCFINVGARVLGNWTSRAELRDVLAKRSGLNASAVVGACTCTKVVNGSSTNGGWCENYRRYEAAVRLALSTFSSGRLEQLDCGVIVAKFASRVCTNTRAQQLLAGFPGSRDALIAAVKRIRGSMRKAW